MVRIGFALIVVLSTIVISLCYVFFHISNCTEGQKIGKIVKISKEGLLSKTWEGELIRGGFSDGSGTLGSSFHFTIENETFVKLAKEYMENKSDVILQYHTEFISSRLRSESSSPHFVDNIAKGQN